MRHTKRKLLGRSSSPCEQSARCDLIRSKIPAGRVAKSGQGTDVIGCHSSTNSTGERRDQHPRWLPNNLVPRLRRFRRHDSPPPRSGGVRSKALTRGIAALSTVFAATLLSSNVSAHAALDNEWVGLTVKIGPCRSSNGIPSSTLWPRGPKPAQAGVVSLESRDVQQGRRRSR